MKNQYTFLKICFVFFAISFLELLSAQDCQISTAATDLDVNNVKARLAVGGDLWWSGGDGRYIVPKPNTGEPEVSAFHLGGIVDWRGWDSRPGNLKLAAQTYGRAFGEYRLFSWTIRLSKLVPQPYTGDV